MLRLQDTFFILFTNLIPGAGRVGDHTTLHDQINPFQSHPTPHTHTSHVLNSFFRSGATRPYRNELKPKHTPLTFLYSYVLTFLRSYVLTLLRSYVLTLLHSYCLTPFHHCENFCPVSSRFTFSPIIGVITFRFSFLLCSVISSNGSSHA